MDPDSFGLLGLHRFAQRFGDGLKPELAALLERTLVPPAGTELLPVRAKSAGPTQNDCNPTALRALGIPQIGPVGPKEGTHG